jgi:hypothetical protein
VQHAPGRSLDARREDRIRDAAAATLRPQAEACWAHQDHVRHQIRIERGHGQRCSGTNGDAHNSDLLELQPAAEICQAHGELRRRSGTDARPAISRAGGDEHRVTGFEKDLLAEPTTGRHMATCKINTAAPPRRCSRYSIVWPSIVITFVAGGSVMEQILLAPSH